MQVTIVRFLDAWNDARPHVTPSEIGPEPPRSCVGFLIKEDSEYYYLASIIDTDGIVGHVNKIPKGCVVAKEAIDQ